MQTLHIATACFINKSNAVLVVRKKGAQAWMLPGGKLDQGERPEQAVIRELYEELQLSLSPQELSYLGKFHATAANEANTCVSADVFLAKLPSGQDIQIAAEIEAFSWLPLHGEMTAAVAPLLKKKIIPELQHLLN